VGGAGDLDVDLGVPGEADDDDDDDEECLCERCLGVRP
jgi:hypothetical protein